MATPNLTPRVRNPQSVFLYFITTDKGTPIKIGIADDLDRRMGELQTAHYETLRLVGWIECPSRDKALKLESAFHGWYRSYIVRGEWFRVSPDQVVKDIQLLSELSQHITSIHIKQSPETIKDWHSGYAFKSMRSGVAIFDRSQPQPADELERGEE